MQITKTLPLLLLTACASLTGGTTQKFAITTSPEEHANCVLANSRGSWIAQSPATLTIHRSGDMLKITCDTPTLRGETVVAPKMKALTAVNAIMGPLGGLAGWGVDEASGAAYSYPTSTTLTLSKKD